MRAGLLVVLALIPIGCSGPGGLFGLSPQGQRELPATETLRKSVPADVALPRELDKRVAPPYVIEPGDILLVQPADLDSPLRLPGDQPVLPDGTIHLGKYGEIVVAGQTIADAEKLVRAHVTAQAKEGATLVLRLVSRQSKVYYVLGEVNAPGAYQLSGRETVLDGILAAGGVTTKAALNRISMNRPTPPHSCRAVLPICYEEIVQMGDTSTNYQLAAGDRIFVPAKTTCEEIFHSKDKQCVPCGQPQSSCFAGGGAGPECANIPYGYAAGAAVPGNPNGVGNKQTRETAAGTTSQTRTAAKPAAFLGAPRPAQAP